jgi:hypothetical protein
VIGWDCETIATVVNITVSKVFFISSVVSTKISKYGLHNETKDNIFPEDYQRDRTMRREPPVRFPFGCPER